MNPSSGQTMRFELMQGAPFAVIQVDAAGKVLACNAAAERLLGVRGEDALGRSIAEVVPVPGRTTPGSSCSPPANQRGESGRCTVTTSGWCGAPGRCSP